MKKSLNLIQKLLFVRKLNQTFTGSSLQDFTSWSVRKDKKIFLQFFFSNGKKLLLVTEKPETNEKTIELVSLVESVIAAWSKSKINGFSFIDFSFRNAISFLERERGRRILRVIILEQPKIA